MKFVLVLAVALTSSSVFASDLQPGSTPRINGDALAVAEVARISLRTYNIGGQLVVGLCDGTNCSIISINGVNASPYNVRPAYHFGFTKSIDILSPVVAVLRQEKGSTWVANQDIVFVVQRLSPYVMAVWMEENPSFIITVPVQTTHFSLKVWTNVGIWSFIEEGMHTGMNSAGLPALGSTADKPSDQRLNGDPLAPFEVIGVEIQVIREKLNTDGTTYAVIALCGRICSDVVVTGLNATSPYGYPSFLYNTGYTVAGSESGAFTYYERTEGLGAFKYGQNVTFLVQRLGTEALAVWMENRPEYVVTMPVARDRVNLRVRTQYLGVWKFSGNNNTELAASKRVQTYNHLSLKLEANTELSKSALKPINLVKYLSGDYD